MVTLCHCNCTFNHYLVQGVAAFMFEAENLDFQKVKVEGENPLAIYLH